MLSDWFLPFQDPENIMTTARALRAIGGLLLAIAQLFFLFV